MDFHVIIVNMAVILGAVTFGSILCHLAKIPSIVGYITSGIIIGPFGAALIGSIPGTNIITEFASIFLLFTIGLELSFFALKFYKRLIFITGLCQLVFSWVIFGLIAWSVFHRDVSQSIFWGFLLSLSSTAIVMKLLTEKRELNSTYGKTITGILITQDLFVIPMTLVLPLLVASHSIMSGVSFPQVGMWAGKFVGIILVIFLGTKYVFPKLFESTAKIKSRETFFFSVIFFCLGFAMLFERMQLSLALGAFLAGLLIADSPFGKKASIEMELIRDIFLALFFCSVGTLIDIDFILKNFVNLILVTIAVILGKTFIAYIASRLAGVTHRDSLVAGILTAQVGEFSFVLAEIGNKAKLFSADGYQFFLGITVLTMLVTPFSFLYVPRALLVRPLKKHDHRDDEDVFDVLIVGFGVAGQSLAKALKKENKKYKIIESNYSLVKKYSKLGEPIFYGDGANAEFLEHNQIHGAKVVVICVAGIKGTETVLHAIVETKTKSKIFVRITYSIEKVKIQKLIDNDQIIDAEKLASEELIGKVMGSFS